MEYKHTTTYNNHFWLPVYLPRSRKHRYYRDWRPVITANPFNRIKLRSKATRFNPWVYNNRPHVCKPYRYNPH